MLKDAPDWCTEEENKVFPFVHRRCGGRSLQILLLQASVDDKQKDGGNRSSARQGVFDSREFREQLRREVGVRNVLVMWGESVALQTEWTDPELSAYINLTGIENISGCMILTRWP